MARLAAAEAEAAARASEEEEQRRRAEQEGKEEKGRVKELEAEIAMLSDALQVRTPPLLSSLLSAFL